MKKKKFIVIFIILLAIYSLITIFVVNYFQDDNDSPVDNPIIEPGTIEYENYYLVIEDTDYWRFSDSGWTKLKNYDTGSKKFSVMIDSEYYGDYYLKYIKNWNLSDDDNDFVNYNGKFLAFSKNFDVNVTKFTIEELSSEEISEINDIINFYIDDTMLSLKEKAIVDLDRNGINDKIVNVSNLDAENQEYYFNLIYVVLNNNVKILLKKDIPESDILIEPTYNLNYVLNINNESYDSIVIKTRYFSLSREPGNILFQYKDNEYKYVIGN